MFSRVFSLLLTLLSFGMVSAQTKPNVLVIVVDDLNDYTGFLGGHPQAQTPNMDLIAGRGTVFTNAFCNSPGCAPSRTSFLTGKSPIYTQVINNKHFLEETNFRDLFTTSKGNETVYTLPEILKDSGGYFTMGFEKVSHRGVIEGFDNDYDLATGDPCARAKSWNAFAEIPYTTPEPSSGTEPYDGVGSLRLGQLDNAEEPNMRDALHADSLKQFLEAYAADPSQFCDKPFFVTWGAYRPHLPFYAPEKYFLPYYRNNIYAVPLPQLENDPPQLWPANGVVMPQRPTPPITGLEGLSEIALEMYHSKVRDEDNFRNAADSLTSFPVVEPGLDSAAVRIRVEAFKKAQAVMAYLASITFVDAQIGEILETLQEQGLRDNTIIVLMSDHGYALGERNHWRKFALWETDIRIPFVILDPRKDQSNQSVRTTSLVDLFPTLLSLTETPVPRMPDGSRYLDGEDLSNLLEQPESSHHRPAHSAYKMPEAYKKGNCFPQESVRSEQWHLIRYRSNGTPNENCDTALATTTDELYELGRFRTTDPEEFNNLVTEPFYDRVRDYLGQWMSDGPFYNRKTPEAIIQQLSSCGDDSLMLRAGIRLKNGSIRSNLPPANFNVTWRIKGGPTLSGATLKVPATQPVAEVQLEISRTGQPEPFLLATERFRLSQDTADLTFTTNLTGDLLTIEGVGFPQGISSSTWNYGDGFESFSKEPLQRKYAPGSYTITRTLSFGPSQTCPLSTSRTINVSPPAPKVQRPEVTERMLLFPNPTTGLLKVRYASPSDQEVTMEVLDITGKTVHRSKHRSTYGRNDYSLSLPPDQNGVFFLRIQGESTQISGSFWVE